MLRGGDDVDGGKGDAGGGSDPTQLRVRRDQRRPPAEHARYDPAPRAGDGSKTGDDRRMSDARADHRPGRPRGERARAVRALSGGVRGRRRLQALAGEDRDRGRRSHVLPDHDEPPPAAHQRPLRVSSRSRARTSSSGRSSTRWPSGMTVGDVSGKAIANLATEELSHPNPVFHGDTLFCESEVLEVRPSQSKPDRGVVKVHTRVYKQTGELVAEFKRAVLGAAQARTATTPGPPRATSTDALEHPLGRASRGGAWHSTRVFARGRWRACRPSRGSSWGRAYLLKAGRVGGARGRAGSLPIGEQVDRVGAQRGVRLDDGRRGSRDPDFAAMRSPPRCPVIESPEDGSCSSRASSTRAPSASTSTPRSCRACAPRWACSTRSSPMGYRMPSS